MVTMDLKQCYEQLGGDYNDALTRMMNEGFVERFIIKFLDDKTFESMKSAIESGNVVELFKGAHTMKGIAGNLGFTKLGETASALTEHLRGRDSGEIDQQLVKDFLDAYQQVADAINAYKASK